MIAASASALTIESTSLVSGVFRPFSGPDSSPSVSNPSTPGMGDLGKDRCKNYRQVSVKVKEITHYSCQEYHYFMKRIVWVGFGFALGVVVMLLLPDFSFEQRTIDRGFQISSSRSSEAQIPIHLFTVTHVVDGDTIDVRRDNDAVLRVRVIGIDTPETVDPDRPVECFGRQASDRMKALALDTDVVLVSKPDEDMDQHGRLLRYVERDGVDLGATLIAEGYAESYCKKYPHPRCSLYEALQEKAKQERLGLWSGCRK